MSFTTAPAFDEPQLARSVERLPDVVVHGLPYGAIRLDRDGRVVFFSDAEARLSGYDARPTIGRDFFKEIAPCFATDAFLGRIERARAAGTLDIELELIGDFDDADKELRCRAQSASDGGIWIFIQRL
jgi:photoactive yellow protein